MIEISASVPFYQLVVSGALLSIGWHAGKQVFVTVQQFILSITNRSSSSE